MKRILSCLMAASLASAVCGLGACSHERFAPQRDAVLNIPERYPKQLPEEEHALGEACRQFGLPRLPDLLAQMNRENFQTREARARIAAAEAAADQAAGALWPRASANAEASRGKLDHNRADSRPELLSHPGR